MPKHHEHKEHSARPKRKWWQWVALGLMLLAIGTYVLTLDDSVVPGEKVSTGAGRQRRGPAPGNNLAAGEGAERRLGGYGDSEGVGGVICITGAGQAGDAGGGPGLLAGAGGEAGAAGEPVALIYGAAAAVVGLPVLLQVSIIEIGAVMLWTSLLMGLGMAPYSEMVLKWRDARWSGGVGWAQIWL